MQIRDWIVNEFLGNGELPSVASTAAHFDMDVEALRRHLKESQPLPSLKGLTPDQALRVVERYGSGVVFVSSIESALKGFDENRRKIEKREQEFGGRDHRK